jgi:hypothetical protein
MKGGGEFTENNVMEQRTNYQQKIFKTCPIADKSGV